MPGKFDHIAATAIAAEHPPFWALIQAAAMVADPTNLAALERAFPAEIAEMQLRTAVTGGLVDEAHIAEYREYRARAEAGAGGAVAIGARRPNFELGPCKGCDQPTIYTTYCSDCQVDLQVGQTPGTFYATEIAPFITDPDPAGGPR